MSPSMGDGVEGGPPRAAMATAMGARGELGSGRERDWRKLGQVAEGVGVLTMEGIEPRRPRQGDRCGWSVLGEEQSKQKLGRGRRWAAWLDGSVSSMVARRAGWGAFYRR